MGKTTAMEIKLALPIDRKYLNKEACREEARKLLQEGWVCGMSEKQIAQEIYSHAAVFYYCERTGRFTRLMKYADPIDLRDGGDNLLRRLGYAACWLLKSSRG